MTNIIKNNSQGYGYKYASLTDIATQGVEIPKMKTGTDPISLKDYIYYWDTDLNEWIRGAEIVPTENKSMNNAQNYASGVTYARRVSVQLAKQLACGDDEVVENTNADGTNKEPAKVSQRQIEYIVKLYDAPMVAKILQYYQIENLTQLTIEQASEVIEKAKKRNNEKSNQQQ